MEKFDIPKKAMEKHSKSSSPPPSKDISEKPGANEEDGATKTVKKPKSKGPSGAFSVPPPKIPMGGPYAPMTQNVPAMMDELTAAMKKENAEISKNPLNKQTAYLDQIKPFSENILVLGQNKIDSKKKI